MGKATVRISNQLIKSFLQMPDDWNISDYWAETEFGYTDLTIMVYSESIQNVPGQKLPEYIGKFSSKKIDGQDGVWVQGHWELFRK